jgi:vacuolar-type H+-ATPase subunit I/STV1
MRIHETFTKKDIVNIIEKNKIPNIDIKLTRYEIVKELISYINNNNYDKYSFLENENKNKKLTIKEKNEIIIKAQQIISLHKNGYNFSSSCYEDKKDLLNECKYIAQFGDISSVRRAIKFVNKQYSLNLNCIISNDINEKLQHKEQLKKDSTPKISFTFKKCIVEFD